MKVNLIFGHSGYLAKNLYQELIKRKQKVFVVTRKKIKKKNFINIDTYNKKKINFCLNKIKPKYIWNMIGINSKDFNTNIRINYEISKNIIDTNYNLKHKPKILLIGSIAEYGNYKDRFNENDYLNPVNNYGLSKAFQTMYALNHSTQFKTKIILARISNIFGEQMSEKFFLRQAYDYNHSLKKKIIIYKNFKRDYVHISEVVKMIYKTMHKGKIGEVYNVGRGMAVSNLTMFNNILKKKKLKINSKNVTIRNNKIYNTIYFDIKKFKNI